MCKQKINFHSYLTLYTKVSSKWIVDLIVKPKIIQLLQENIGENLCDLGLGKYFFDMTLKSQYIKEKNQSTGLHHDKNVCSLKKAFTVKKIEIGAMDWRKYL